MLPFFFAVKTYPTITLEQLDFLERMWAIPFARRSWKRLVTLDTHYAFCGGPESTPKAR